MDNPSIRAGPAKEMDSSWTRDKLESAKGSLESSRSSSASKAAEGSSKPARGSSSASKTNSSFGVGEDAYNRQIRSKYKRLTTIVEDHGKSFPTPTNEAELREMETVAMGMRRNDIKLVMKELRRARKFDLCFLIDATESMDRHIKTVKDVIANIVEAFTKPTVKKRKESSTLTQMRLACVGYRDHCDKRRFEILDFTDDVDCFKAFLGNLEAIGGGDIPEDVLGGLNAVCRLNWSSDSGVKQIFHMGDAPPHGKRFCEPKLRAMIADSFPDGHPEDPHVEEIFQWTNKQQIYYIFGKMNEYTHLMVEEFEKAAGKPLDVFDVHDSQRIAEALKESISLSVSRQISFSKMSVATHISVRPYSFEKHIPDWSTVKAVEGRLQSYDMPKSIEQILNDEPPEKRVPSKVLMKIAPHPFAEGTERVAFYGLKMAHEPIPVILKEFKRNAGSEAKASHRYELVNQMQTTVEYLAFKFAEALRNTRKFEPFEMEFLKVKTFSTESPPYHYMNCELKFKDSDKFIRFSNNVGYTLFMLLEDAEKCGLDPKYVAMMMAFSHWTYSETRNKLIVVDLQGVVSTGTGGKVEIRLTDPAVHSTDVTRYGSLNHGVDGMIKFFESHDCNEFCQALELQPSNACLAFLRAIKTGEDDD